MAEPSRNSVWQMRPPAREIQLPSAKLIIAEISAMTASQVATGERILVTAVGVGVGFGVVDGVELDGGWGDVAGVGGVGVSFRITCVLRFASAMMLRMAVV